MNLVQINDLVLADVGITNAIVTSETSSLNYAARRRDSADGSVWFGTAHEPAVWSIIAQCPTRAVRDQVIAVLTGSLDRPVRLVAELDDGTDDPVWIRASLASIPDLNDLDVTFDMESDSSEWTYVDPETATATFGTTSQGLVRLYPRGNTRTYPTLRFDATANKSSPTVYAGWKYQQRWTITNNSDKPWLRFPVRISLGSTTAIVSGGKAQSDGDDVRVVLNGIEQARTLVTWNTSNSYIWVVIPSLNPGEAITYDVIYGNSAATNPPTLAYPDLPAFDLATSTNASLVYLTDRIAANTGKGLWYLSRTAPPARPDYSVPGAWMPTRFLTNDENNDLAFLLEFDTDSTYTWAVLYAARLSRDAEADLSGVSLYQTHASLNDGIEFYWPLPISSLNTSFFWTNIGGRGALYYRQRSTSDEAWSTFYTEVSQVSNTGIADGAQSCASGMHHIGIWLAPANGWEMASTTDAANLIEVVSGSIFTVAINTTNLSIVQTQVETEVYELATEVRVYGGATERVPPYYALLIGNARNQTGAGTPRAFMPLGSYEFVVDCAAQTAAVFAASGGDLYLKYRDVPAFAIRGVQGWRDDEGVTVEAETNEWLPVVPSRLPVTNGTFPANITGVTSDGQTSGMTVTRAWSSSIGGVANGSYSLAVTANSAGVNGLAISEMDQMIDVRERDSITVAAWLRSSATNLIPLLGLRFYDDIGGSVIEDQRAGTYAVVANTGVDRPFAFAVPDRARYAAITLNAYDNSSNTTGTVYFDDIRVNDADLWIKDEAVGTLVVVAEVYGGVLI